MSIFQVILRELSFRRWNFWLAVLSVAAASGSVVGALALLERHDQRTAEIVAAQQAETQERTKKLEDDYRKIMRELGFNLLILPREQNLAELYADDYGSRTMPEEYAERLAKSRIATINHILPQLQRKLKWTERERTVIVVGVRGELAMAVGNDKKPLLERVPPNSVVLGYELHRSLQLQVGDTIQLQGREFTVSKLHPERGAKDDITLWIPLAEAQDLFQLPGRINAILALECNCAADRLAVIRADVAAVLPDTQVVELNTQAVARAEARNRAAVEARQANEQVLRDRDTARAAQQRFAEWLTPLVIVAALLAIASLALTNARERMLEIGTLRAIGWRSAQIIGLFLVKALLIGLVGAILGTAAGGLIGSRLGDPATAWWPIAWPTWAAVLALTPLLTMLATWVPAIGAVRHDPAVILNRA